MLFSMVIHCEIAAQSIPKVLVPMFFEDAIGNRDTIYAGFDASAGRELTDSNFGEVDITNKQWAENFEVRIGPSLYPYKFSSKVDIQKGNCTDSTLGYLATGHSIYMKAKFLPIKWSWGTNIFKSRCLQNSFYDRGSVSEIGGKFGPGIQDDVVYLNKLNGKTLITEDFLKDKPWQPATYADFLDPITKDTIFAIRFYLLDSLRGAFRYASSKDIKIESLKFFPNPVENTLNVVLDESILSEKGTLSITNILGQEVYQINQQLPQSTINIDVSNLFSGTYILKYDTRDRQFRAVFIKLD